MEMVEIQIGFSRSRDWWKIGSKVIKSTEKRPFSHAYMKYVDPTTKELMISQASHGYVNEVHIDQFVKDNIITHEYTLKLTQQQFVEILTFCKKNMGKKYSQLGIFLIAIKKVFHIELDKADGTDAYICSEWAAHICKIAQFLDKARLDFVTPSDLDKLLSAILDFKPNLVSMRVY